MKKATVLSAALLCCLLNAGSADADEDHLPRAKFYGTVEALPGNGRTGIWRISGRDFLVTYQTEIKEKHGAATIGAYVELEGQLAGSSFTVAEMEVQTGGNRRLPAAYNFRFSGMVEKMPENGYEGQWIVGGRPVEVDRAAVIDETAGKAVSGCRATIIGVRNGNAVKALEIRVAGIP